jgi:hypothetical protein
MILVILSLCMKDLSIPKQVAHQQQQEEESRHLAGGGKELVGIIL